MAPRLVRRSAAQTDRGNTLIALRHAWRSWTPEESQVESCEHQDNANIHHQPFPESVSEEHEIYTDYNGCHRHSVEHVIYLSDHLVRPRFWHGFTKRVHSKTRSRREFLQVEPELRRGAGKGCFVTRRSRKKETQRMSSSALVWRRSWINHPAGRTSSLKQL